MTGIALGLDTLTTSLVSQRTGVEAQLMLGATRQEAVAPVTRQALRSAHTAGHTGHHCMRKGQVPAEAREAERYSGWNQAATAPAQARTFFTPSCDSLTPSAEMAAEMARSDRPSRRSCRMRRMARCW